jgi:hypothetical protein
MAADYACHVQYPPIQPGYCPDSDFPIDSDLSHQAPVASSSKITLPFVFPSLSDVPMASHDGLFDVQGFNTEPWPPYPNVGQPMFIMAFDAHLQSGIPMNNPTDGSEPLQLKSPSIIYPAVNDTNHINVLKPGGTPSPLKSPRKRKRADSGAASPTLRRSARSQALKNDQSLNNDKSPKKRESPKKRLK